MKLPKINSGKQKSADDASGRKLTSLPREILLSGELQRPAQKKQVEGMVEIHKAGVR